MFPVLCFGQGGYYNSNKSDVSKLCDFYRGNSFMSNTAADDALNKILNVTGMSKRFVLFPCNNIDNCLATSFKGVRYILYDPYFMQEIADNTDSWSKISILAHEIGHHVNGHSIDLLSISTGHIDAPSLTESRQMEIEADEFSGFVMQKLGASLSQAQAAMNKYASTGDDSYSTHPSKYKRLSAIERGYKRARNEVDNNSNYSNNANNNKIDYLNRAKTKVDLEDYDGAILIISNHIKLNNQDAEAYFSRGFVKWKKACSILKKEHNIDITSDVNLKYAYGKKPFTTNNNRIREICEIYNLELPDFCADFSKGCTLKGDCDYWKKYCK